MITFVSIAVLADVGVAFGSSEPISPSQVTVPSTSVPSFKPTFNFDGIAYVDPIG